MASINIHTTQKGETKFIIGEHGETFWIDITRGDDTVSIFFKTKDNLNNFLGMIQTEIYAYQREKE